MRIQFLICAFALAAFAIAANATSITVSDPGDAGTGVCGTTCTLRQAIATATAAGGGNIVFANPPTLTYPATITLGGQPLSITKPMTITGPGAGLLTISANNASQVFVVSAAASISKLTIADGNMTGTAGNNGAGGTPGSSGIAGGPGGTGGPGGLAGGACVQVANTGALVLDHVAVRHCIASGGSGGAGGAGGSGDLNPMDIPSAGGAGGNGAAGGTATGGAILVYGTLSLLNSSVVDGEVHGGAGGNGAPGGIGNSGGSIVFGASGISGVGGAANGGAIFVAAGSLRITNSTIADSSATGGNGGAGVTNNPNLTIGGAGGAANGGLIRVDPSANLADIEFSTFAGGQAVGGSGGTGQAPPFTGPSGVASGNAISAGTTATALSSVIVDVQSGVSLCDGQVVAAGGSANLSDDNSCSGFTLHPTPGTTLKPLDASATPAYMPIWKSPAIDAAAGCILLGSPPPPVWDDQHDTPRPQGGACDLGAIEADYIFVDGFGN